MNVEIYSEFIFGDTAVQYVVEDEGNEPIGLRLLPTSMRAKVLPRNHPVDPLVHVCLRGELHRGGFANGRTMRGSSPALVFDRQNVVESADCVIVETRLKNEQGYACEHRLSWTRGEAALEVWTAFENHSDSLLTLEMITSFSLGGITPFDPADAPERLIAHRFRSGWCQEGRHEHFPIEMLHLERSHSGIAAFSERFGQIGSMPVRGFFPFVAIEDSVEKVFWGAQLAWAGSWQMEIYRKFDDVTLSGGLADREFGHWFKHIQPGARFETPRAILANASGTIDDLCACLTSVQQRAADSAPASERDLPIVFNEWCTTWGNPSHKEALAIADRLHGLNVRTLVIDAGWYRTDGGCGGHGDWNPSTEQFPAGLAATAQAIRERGLIPGLWAEMETCTARSTAFSLTDHLLKLDGAIITIEERRFWDFRDPWVHEYLAERLIELLKRCGFGYLKVDYNETVGIGCDGAESPGEGLRQQIQGIYSFFRKIRKALPELVIESCSSGGHRLEPSMMALSSQASFSDAHEAVEIPVIAANLHRLILPRQSQIWAVLRPADSDCQLVYSLTSTLLGRMCLSGNLTELSEHQMDLVKRACTFYRRAHAIIRDGRSRRFGPELLSYRHPHGWQALMRTVKDKALVVIHSFASPTPHQPEIDLPMTGTWTIDDVFQTNSTGPTVENNRLVCQLEGEFSASAILLRRAVTGAVASC